MVTFRGSYISCEDLCGLRWRIGAVSSTENGNEILAAEGKSDEAQHLIKNWKRYIASRDSAS